MQFPTNACIFFGSLYFIIFMLLDAVFLYPPVKTDQANLHKEMRKNGMRREFKRTDQPNTKERKSKKQSTIQECCLSCCGPTAKRTPVSILKVHSRRTKRMDSFPGNGDICPFCNDEMCLNFACAFAEQDVNMTIDEATAGIHENNGDNIAANADNEQVVLNELDYSYAFATQSSRGKRPFIDDTSEASGSSKRGNGIEITDILSVKSAHTTLTQPLSYELSSTQDQQGVHIQPNSYDMNQRKNGGNQQEVGQQQAFHPQLWNLQHSQQQYVEVAAEIQNLPYHYYGQQLLSNFNFNQANAQREGKDQQPIYGQIYGQFNPQQQQVADKELPIQFPFIQQPQVVVPKPPRKKIYKSEEYNHEKDYRTQIIKNLELRQPKSNRPGRRHFMSTEQQAQLFETYTKQDPEFFMACETFKKAKLQGRIPAEFSEPLMKGLITLYQYPQLTSVFLMEYLGKPYMATRFQDELDLRGIRLHINRALPNTFGKERGFEEAKQRLKYYLGKKTRGDELAIPQRGQPDNRPALQPFPDCDDQHTMYRYIITWNSPEQLREIINHNEFIMFGYRKNDKTNYICKYTEKNHHCPMRAYNRESKSKFYTLGEHNHELQQQVSYYHKEKVWNYVTIVIPSKLEEFIKINDLVHAGGGEESSNQYYVCKHSVQLLCPMEALYREFSKKFFTYGEHNHPP